jgi:hypothetical protein
LPTLSVVVVSFFCVTEASWLQIKYILENCKEDMEFFDQWIEKGIITRLTVSHTTILFA